MSENINNSSVVPRLSLQPWVFRCASDPLNHNTHGLGLGPVDTLLNYSVHVNAFFFPFPFNYVKHCYSNKPFSKYPKSNMARRLRERNSAKQITSRLRDDL